VSTIYIDRRGATVSAVSGVLTVESTESGTKSRFPLALIDRIVFRADTQISTATLCAITDAGISVIAMGGRTGEKVCQMVGGWSGNAQIRVAQINCLAKADYRLEFARKTVSAKIRRQLRTLASIGATREDLRKPCFDATATLQKCLAQTFEAGSVDALRGLEGAAAAGYFAAYFQAFPPSLSVTHRRRRPPPDPVNAALSLSYTLLYSIATSACWQAGLDSAVGALHGLSHGRAALACDLMEPWRADVDLWVWEQFRTREIRAEHFGLDGAGGCLLGKAGRAHFYSQWAQKDRLYSSLLRRQARLCASAFLTAQKRGDLILDSIDDWQSL
jgi:CRISP-associated protein Cas1